MQVGRVLSTHGRCAELAPQGGLAEEQHYRTGGKGGLECGMASRTDKGETSAVSQEIFGVREDV